MVPSDIRELAVEGLLNLRDLGGLPIEGGGETRYRRLLRSDVPRRISAAGREALLELGVGTIIDLRTETERSEAPSLLIGVDGLEHVHAPIFTDADVFPEQLVTAADVNVHWVRDRGPRVAAALTAIADAHSVPVLFHCHAGKDRTGLIAALMLRLAAVSVEAVAADYAASGVHLADKLERDRHRALGMGMDEATAERLFTVRHDQMVETVQRLELEYGDMPALLAAVGVDAARAERLTEILTAPTWP